MIVSGPKLAVVITSATMLPTLLSGVQDGETPTRSEDTAVAQIEQVELTVWDHLADCESGEWDRNSNPISGTANWHSTEHGLYQGGLQFHPDTWDGFKPSGYPDEAYQANRNQQIRVAERVLEAQGWGAWPACSRKLGLR